MAQRSLMRWLFDTNVFIEAAAGKSHAMTAFEQGANAEWLAYSIMSRIEALGFPKIEEPEEIDLLRLFGQYSEIGLTDEIALKAIEIRRDIRIDVPDAVIAATAFIHSAELVTRNVHDFKNVLGLKIIDPTTL